MLKHETWLNVYLEFWNGGFAFYLLVQSTTLLFKLELLPCYVPSTILSIYMMLKKDHFLMSMVPNTQTTHHMLATQQYIRQKVLSMVLIWMLFNIVTQLLRPCGMLTVCTIASLCSCSVLSEVINKQQSLTRFKIQVRVQWASECNL